MKYKKLYPHEKEELLNLIWEEWERYPHLSFFEIIEEINPDTYNDVKFSDFRLLQAFRKGKHAN